MAKIFTCAYWQNSYYYSNNYNKNNKQVNRVLPF